MKRWWMAWLGLLVVGCGPDDEVEVDGGGSTVDGGAAVDGGGDGGGVADNVPGKHEHRFVLEDSQREVIVYVPQRAVGKRAPVVMMLHGTSGDGEKFYNISGWKEKADTEGLIAVFPTALVYCYAEDENEDGDFDDPGEHAISTKWAAGKLGGPKMPLCTPAELAQLPPARRAEVDHPLRDDVAYVRAILDLLAREYVIDARRVYVSGFSNGGSMSGRLAMELSDRFAAAACNSGFLSLPPVAVPRPISVVLTSGEVDDKVLARLGIAALPMRESLLTEVPYVETGVAAPMRTVQSVGSTYGYDERVVGGRKVIRYRWTESQLGATNAVELLVVEGLGHAYPNGTNSPLVMADYLWTVFRERSL